MLKEFIKKIGQKISDYVNKWLKKAVEFFFSIPVGYRIGWGIFIGMSVAAPEVAGCMILFLFISYLAIQYFGGIVSSLFSLFTPVRDVTTDSIGKNLEGGNSNK